MTVWNMNISGPLLPVTKVRPGIFVAELGGQGLLIYAGLEKCDVMALEQDPGRVISRFAEVQQAKRDAKALESLTGEKVGAHTDELLERAETAEDPADRFRAWVELLESARTDLDDGDSRES